MTLDHRIFPLDMLFFYDGGFEERFNELLFPFRMLRRGVIISMNLVDSRFLPLNVLPARTCSQLAGGLSKKVTFGGGSRRELFPLRGPIFRGIGSRFIRLREPRHDRIEKSYFQCWGV
jgi:hypothetical protein